MTRSQMAIEKMRKIAYEDMPDTDLRCDVLRVLDGYKESAAYLAQSGALSRYYAEPYISLETGEVKHREL